LKAIRLATVALSLALGVAAALHIVLLASDSDAYRRWVYLQMALLVTCSILLWYSRGSRVLFLAGAVAVGVPAIFINHTYLNYGGSSAVWALPATLAVAVAGVAIYQWLGRAARPN
jgi:hypothetical protein